jgi:hypothetical protein
MGPGSCQSVSIIEGRFTRSSLAFHGPEATPADEAAKNNRKLVQAMTG